MRALAILLLTAGISLAGPNPETARQNWIGETACGPTALYNALVTGPPAYRAIVQKFSGEDAREKLLGLAANYGKLPSRAYPNRPVFDKTVGSAKVDILKMANAVLEDADLPPLEGQYLERAGGESQVDHLRRVHRLLRQSLQHGVPVITSVRSFVARKNVNAEDFSWHGVQGHFITITEVQETLREDERGFSFSYIDAVNGKTRFGYIHGSQDRNFSAVRGNMVDFEWLGDHPFLLITAPMLWVGQEKQNWHERTVITLDYAIYSTKPVPEPEPPDPLAPFYTNPFAEQ